MIRRGDTHSQIASSLSIPPPSLPSLHPSLPPSLPTHLLIQHHLLVLHVPACLLLAEQAPTRADEALPNIDPHKLQVQIPARHHAESADRPSTIDVGQQNTISHDHHRPGNHNLLLQNISQALGRRQDNDRAGLGRDGVAELSSIGDTAGIVHTGASGLGKSSSPSQDLLAYGRDGKGRCFLWVRGR